MENSKEKIRFTKSQLFRFLKKKKKSSVSEDLGWGVEIENLIEIYLLFDL